MIGFFIRIRNSLIYRIRLAYFRLTTNYWQFITRILISNKRERKQRESLFVWVPVWGNRHIDWFFEYALPSLLTSDNLPLVAKKKNIKICFYTKDSDSSLIAERMESQVCNYKYSIQTESNFNDHARDMMSNFMIHILDECIKNNALMLVTLPDFIFSNGSVSNMVELSDGKGVSVSVAHPRVSVESLKKNNIDIANLSKNTLNMVKVAMKCRHESLLQADETNDLNSTTSGIATRQIPSGLAVIHNLPAVYLCSPIKDDLSFFKRRPDFNSIDKHWPNLLFRQSRLKVVGSSDIAFLIELTSDADKKPIVESGMKYNDQYLSCGSYLPFVNYSNVIVGLWRSK